VVGQPCQETWDVAAYPCPLQRPPTVGEELLCGGTLRCPLEVLLLPEVQGLWFVFSEDVEACSGKG